MLHKLFTPVIIKQLLLGDAWNYSFKWMFQIVIGIGLHVNIMPANYLINV